MKTFKNYHKKLLIQLIFFGQRIFASIWFINNNCFNFLIIKCFELDIIKLKS